MEKRNYMAALTLASSWYPFTDLVVQPRLYSSASAMILFMHFHARGASDKYATAIVRRRKMVWYSPRKIIKKHVGIVAYLGNQLRWALRQSAGAFGRNQVARSSTWDWKQSSSFSPNCESKRNYKEEPFGCSRSDFDKRDNTFFKQRICFTSNRRREFVYKTIGHSSCLGYSGLP